MNVYEIIYIIIHSDGTQENKSVGLYADKERAEEEAAYLCGVERLVEGVSTRNFYYVYKRFLIT